MALFLFWAAGGVLAFTFAGYPILIGWLARGRPLLKAGNEARLAKVVVVIVARNEEARIVARVDNVLASNYPADQLRVVIVSDGSTDQTAPRVRQLDDPRIRLLEFPSRRGKAAGLNAALREITEEIIVFTDARQRFVPDTISRLASHFGNPLVGAIGGSLEIDVARSAVGQGIDAYWRLERGIRAAEARWDSCIGCTGAVYAIRRDRFTPLPEDTILDDVVIPMQIAIQGCRVLHDPSAIAFDPQPLDPQTERRRKRRTLAGNFQMLFRYPEWLIPSRSRLWWQLLFHKYLRLAAPPLLILTFAANVALLNRPLYGAALGVQAVLLGCGLAGLCFPRLRFRAVTLSAGFLFLNLTTIAAFWQYLAHGNLHQWKESPAKNPV